MTDVRIIDRDINSYTAIVECHTSSLRRCLPSEEADFRALRDSAQAVLDALIAHRQIIDARSLRLAEM